MEYVNFGKAGVQVSRLALGLGFRGQPDEAEAQRVIEHAIDSGINLIDCANIYALMDDRAKNGLSEIVLGRAIKKRRDNVVITSKVAGPMTPGPNGEGLSRYHIMREVEKSLKRIDTDHIDIYLVHRFDELTPLEETIRALDDLVRAGKVCYVGCCNYAAWQVCKALWIADRLNAAPYMCVQNLYNLLNRQPEGEMFALVRDMGLGMMAFSPLAVGLFSGTYSPDRPAPAQSLWATRFQQEFPRMTQDDSAQVISTVKQLADELGKTPAQLALAWVLSHPEITVAITGGDTIEHLDDNIGAVGWTLEDSIREQLDSVSASFVGHPKGSV
ncbi:MAG: aldo/keto reductase [Candidatus Poribacteria bacterium]|nr:aldo/keto reductase [Candidatus Poribacteria bacterium]